MVSVSSDDSIIIGKSGFHAFSDTFLTVVEMTETSDQLALIEFVSLKFCSSHDDHSIEIAHELGLVGGGRHWHLGLFQVVERVDWLSLLFRIEDQVLEVVGNRLGAEGSHGCSLEERSRHF
jgi:hypothetical protein